ncbi:hypothetical protein E8F20_27625 [Pseudomonas sp. BN415]|uniref:hypothetical protein n=1 Tax=Pseudomonas sp. BN415 TaxID=2567889 RepID=UPI0024569E89|nr:hypothetical protein [Pseudomonas sp. BN415]MDH4585622.1 hypothetical protein [Pseudomonas sp. BN415]
MLSLQQAVSCTAKDHPLHPTQLTHQELILIRWYRQLDDNRQENVLRFVSAMATRTTQPPAN